MPLPTDAKTSRQKISKDTEDLSNTINLLALIAVYKALPPP